MVYNCIWWSCYNSTPNNPIVYRGHKKVYIFLLQHLNLEEKDFLSLWITFWSAVIALCGLLQWKISPNTQEQLKASQAQVKIGQEQLTANIKFNQESLDIQQKQLELQANKIIEEQYFF